MFPAFNTRLDMHQKCERTKNDCMGRRGSLGWLSGGVSIRWRGLAGGDICLLDTGIYGVG